MKLKSFAFVLFLSFFILSCENNDISDLGTIIQPSTDEIIVETSTFPLLSENKFVESIYCLPDSFLLGRYNDPTFGAIKADLFTQFMYPKGHSYPENAKVDSVLLVLRYLSWFGDDNSPMNIRVFEMNKKTFDADEKYYSNIDPEDYVDISAENEIVNELIKAKDSGREKGDSTALVFKLSDDFINRFFPGDKAGEVYASDDAFFDFFKGLYITTDYGSSTLLNIVRIDMELYYHYTRTDDNGEEIKVSQNIDFPSNTEVKRVNRYEYLEKEKLKNTLNLHPELHYISSPGNIFTKVSIPIKQMKQEMNVGNKILDINMCQLQVDVLTNEDESEYEQAVPASLLLIKDTEYDNIFSKNMPILPDTTGVVGTYALNSTTEEAYYSFKLEKLIANELKKYEGKEDEIPEYMDMILLPVNSQYINYSYYTSHSYLLSSVIIRSAADSERKMMLRVIYSAY